MTIASLIPFFATLALLGVGVSSAQIQIVNSGASGSYQLNLGSTYTQNFDSLASTGSGKVWANNSTLPGWYSNERYYDIAFYLGDIGSSILGSYGEYGASDRALGSSLDSGGLQTAFGLRFSNGTDTMLSSVTITYDGEQWNLGGNVTGHADTLFFSYQIFDAGTGSITASSGWQTVPALDFTSPHVEFGGMAIDGNLPENRTADIFATLAGLSLAPGQELWIRWQAFDDTFRDYALAIDKLRISFTAVPEPASSAALLSLASLGLAGLRRRPRA